MGTERPLSAVVVGTTGRIESRVMTVSKHETRKCDDCPETGRYIAGWGDYDQLTAIVGTQPGDRHPDESECVFGLDLDWTAWSGEIIEEVFEELDYDISDFYWTNAIKCTEAGDTCDKVLKRELSSFSKIVLLGNKTVDVAPEFAGANVYKIWHPAYVHRNRRKFPAYVRKWREILSEQKPSTLGDFV